MKPAMDALRILCKQRFDEFGTAGHASKIEVVPLADMAKRYKVGNLEPVTSNKSSITEE